ncbi:hypothetical protein [Neobacillus cucumis]|nr:hypothetical protein [Neobacillus cucumis]MBM7654996.1 hypothetical protein [Neobacillus cucumis]
MIPSQQPAESKLYDQLITALFGKQITPEDFARQQEDVIVKDRSKY